MAANDGTAVGYIGRPILLALGGLAVVAVQPALAHGGGGMMGGGYGGGMAGGGFGGFLWPLLLVGGVLAFVYWAIGDGGSVDKGGSVGKAGWLNDGGSVGRGGSNVRGHVGSDPAIETLRERYARGELTDDGYEERRRRLER